MDNEPLHINMRQPALFDFAQTSTGSMELFPAVWSAMEDLTSPRVDLRHSALDRLLQLGAPRLSPLVAYLITTRITDPDLAVRVRVVRIIGDVFAPDQHGQSTSEAVKGRLSDYMCQIDARSVSSLIEASIFDPSIEPHLSRLLNYCPGAALHLADILSDRKQALEERRQAAKFIGLVGFLEAIPALERLNTRLQARLSGQQSMPFAPPSSPDETELLPAIEQALALLRRS